MPTHATDMPEQGVGAAAKSVSEHLSAILRLEIELATLELKRKMTALGLGIGFLLGAAVLLLFVMGFAFATVAAALATFMPTWAGLLIVTGALLLLAGLLGVLGLGRLKKGTPPVPEHAIREAKLTTNALKSNGAGT